MPRKKATKKATKKAATPRKRATKEAKATVPEKEEQTVPAADIGLMEKDQAFELHPSQIVRQVEDNVRKYADADPELASLVKSIRQDGQLQPVMVQAGPGGVPVLVSGFRRVAAIERINEGIADVDKQLKVKCVKVLALGSEHTMAMRIAENMERKSMSAVDIAHTAAMLMDQFDLSLAACASKYFRRTKSWLSKILKVRDVIPEYQAKIHTGEIPWSRVEGISALDEDEQRSLFEAEEKGEEWIPEGEESEEVEGDEESEEGGEKEGKAKKQKAKSRSLKEFRDMIDQSFFSIPNDGTNVKPSQVIACMILDYLDGQKVAEDRLTEFLSIIDESVEVDEKVYINSVGNREKRVQREKDALDKRRAEALEEARKRKARAKAAGKDL